MAEFRMSFCAEHLIVPWLMVPVIYFATGW
jgi:hypothetical protein